MFEKNVYQSYTETLKLILQVIKKKHKIISPIEDIILNHMDHFGIKNA